MRFLKTFVPLAGLSLFLPLAAQDLHTLTRLGDEQSRQISPENPTGKKGQGGSANDGWKGSPWVQIASGETIILTDIKNAGRIRHIWMTPTGDWRLSILRAYWDDEKIPSVEVPIGDFFGMGCGTYAPVNSAAISVNPSNGFNCYWEMPFRQSARFTIQNLDENPVTLYFQFDYELAPVHEGEGYFHAQFRAAQPLPDEQHPTYTVLDGIKGHGNYVGTYLTWHSLSQGWWGEGEVKFFLDGDKRLPTICGTGAEDYFGASYAFRKPGTRTPQVYSSQYAGLIQVLDDDGQSPLFAMYRWHIPDPIHFSRDLKMTIQAMGPGLNPRYDYISSVAYWYQNEPHAEFPILPAADILRQH